MILSGSYEGTEATASALFRLLTAEGRVLAMHGQLGLGGQPRGEPELHRGPDGFLYPVKAVFDYRREDVTFQLEIDHGIGGKGVNIRVHGPVASLDVMERFLSVCGSPRASVVRDRLSGHAVAALYERIRRKATGIRLLPRRWGEACQIRVDGENRLLPERLRLEATLEGRVYTVHFSAKEAEGYEVALEGAADDYVATAALLERLLESEDEIPADPGSGRVQSLSWQVDVKGFGWDCVGGLDAIADRLREWIELPLRNPGAFEHLGIRPPKGVLLCGPPGTGKTTLAKILANESEAAFFAVSPGDIASMWHGETERNISRIFTRARSQATGGRRAILFIDEIDGFFRSREQDAHEATRRALAQIMTEMDGLVGASGVVVLGATNRPEDLDPALRRPGRFDHHLEISLPDLRARREILRVHLRNKPCQGELDLEPLALRTEGMSGAAIELWCNNAAFQAWKRLAGDLKLDPADLNPEDLQGVFLCQADFEATAP